MVEEVVSVKGGQGLLSLQAALEQAWQKFLLTVPVSVRSAATQSKQTWNSSAGLQVLREFLSSRAWQTEPLIEWSALPVEEGKR
eukprot:2069614-Karenia_brevis.AAC.1